MDHLAMPTWCNFYSLYLWPENPIFRNQRKLAQNCLTRNNKSRFFQFLQNYSYSSVILYFYIQHSHFKNESFSLLTIQFVVEINIAILVIGYIAIADLK